MSEIWFPPEDASAGIWIFTCQMPKTELESGETEVTVTPRPVTTGGDVTPRPLRNSVTVEPGEAGFRQVLTEPSGLRASGNNPLTDAELSMVHVASAVDGVAVLRNAAGLLATIGSARESDRFDRAEAKLMFAVAEPAMPKGAWKLTCSPPTKSKGLATPLTFTLTPSSEVGACPAGGVSGLPEENSPNRESSSPGAMEVTGFKSAASRTQSMTARGASGLIAITFVPPVSTSVPAKAS